MQCWFSLFKLSISARRIGLRWALLLCKCGWIVTMDKMFWISLKLKLWMLNVSQCWDLDSGHTFDWVCVHSRPVTPCWDREWDNCELRAQEEGRGLRGRGGKGQGKYCEYWLGIGSAPGYGRRRANTVIRLVPREGPHSQHTQHAKKNYTIETPRENCAQISQSVASLI